MRTQLKPWGNSQAIRIPKEILHEAGISDKDELELEVQDQKIIITKSHRRLSLEERIEKYGPILHFPESDWGEPKGREVW